MSTALIVCLLVAAAPASPCSQPAAERNRLIGEAQGGEYTLRRVEFVGLTYTRDHVLRERMTPIINEGDLFTRAKLARSLRAMSRVGTIYPLRLADVEVRLKGSTREVDIVICFRERPRRRR